MVFPLFLLLCLVTLFAKVLLGQCPRIGQTRVTCLWRSERHITSYKIGSAQGHGLEDRSRRIGKEVMGKSGKSGKSDRSHVPENKPGPTRSDQVISGQASQGHTTD